MNRFLSSTVCLRNWDDEKFKWTQGMQRWWHMLCLPVSPCELVRNSTWAMSAQSHWNITSSITPWYCPFSYSCQGPLILYPIVPGTTAPCVGVNYQRPLPLPAPVAFRDSSESPLHDHGWQSRAQLCLWAEGFSWCEDEWALKFSLKAKSPAWHTVSCQCHIHWKGTACRVVSPFKFNGIVLCF